MAMCCRCGAAEQRDRVPELEPTEVPSSHDPLDLPDWLPRPVGHFAQSLWVDLHRRQAEPEVGALLRRLVSDSRMKKVWNELRRRKRESYEPTENFVHPVTRVVFWFPDTRYYLQHPVKLRQGGGPPVEVLANYNLLMLQSSYQQEGSSLPLQDLGMIYFFDQAFTLGQQDTRLISISWLRKKQRYYLKMAKNLRADASEQERLGLYEGRRMMEAACAYEELVKLPAPAPGRVLLVTRQPQGAARLKGFVMTLGDTTKAVFGTPLCGSAATTANVVFSGNDLTGDAVRKMLSHAPRP
jgi:hypothetical protein